MVLLWVPVYNCTVSALLSETVPDNLKTPLKSPGSGTIGVLIYYSGSQSSYHCNPLIQSLVLW